MADWLREQGYATDTASSLAEGRAAVDRKPYDLVLADIRLGDGDGFDSADALPQEPAGHDGNHDYRLRFGGTAVEAIRLGAFDFLTKHLSMKSFAWHWRGRSINRKSWRRTTA